MRIALVQMNPTIGALRANAAAMARFAEQAADAGARLIVFPELSLTGYPPRDLLLQDGFLRDVREVALHLREDLPDGPTIVVGSPWRAPLGGDRVDAWSDHARPTNSALVYRDGHLIERYDKRLLPTYDVFDEHRYFKPGERAVVVEVDGVPVGLSICEDLWRGVDVGLDERYANEPDPVAELVAAGARVIINPSASPFAISKRNRQREIVARHVRRHGVFLATTNQVGGNDDLIFDGHAAVYAPGAAGGGAGGGVAEGGVAEGGGAGSAAAGGEEHSAHLVAAGPGFVETVLIADLDLRSREAAHASPGIAPTGAAPPGTAIDDPLHAADRLELLWHALVLGVRDYCRKTGFTSVLLGLSGGIDSALTACIAAAALGTEQVLGVAMPSRFSSEGSVTDAELLARGLNLRLLMIPIEPMHRAAEGAIAPAYAALGCDPEPGIAEENLQSRLRGLTLMALSNKTGAMLLTTGNKSELAVGYCTLYGDMNGGLAVLSDITKQDVYALSRWVNANPLRCGFPAGLAAIPENTIAKPPSAELRLDQRDEDTLPPYALLDDVIERYVERLQDPRAIVAETGYDAATVARIIRLIDVNEHKRKQMPIGLKVTTIAFGRGRRRPLAQGYRADVLAVQAAAMADSPR